MELKRMDQHLFYIVLIAEGATGKLSQFRNILKSIYNKPLILMNKNVFLNIVERLKQWKYLH